MKCRPIDDATLGRLVNRALAELPAGTCIHLRIALRFMDASVSIPDGDGRSFEQEEPDNPDPNRIFADALNHALGIE